MTDLTPIPGSCQPFQGNESHDIDTPERLRVIPSLPERGYGRCFLLGSVPNHLVYSWGSTPFVFRHSSHGKSLAAVRVGQQTLQGFDLAPSAFLRCLHNTRLEPKHVAVNGLPVNVMPSCHNVVGSCTSLFDHHLLCLLDRFALLSCERRPHGSLPAFAWGDLACLLNPYPLHYRGAFAFSTFLYPHLHRLPLRVTFPMPGEIWACHVSFPCQSGLGPSLFRREP